MRAIILALWINDERRRDAQRILVVSGRAGFELVQKALKAAIPVMVSVGAASSVAVEMATGAGMALYSFAGPGRGNLHVKASS